MPAINYRQSLSPNGYKQRTSNCSNKHNHVSSVCLYSCRRPFRFTLFFYIEWNFFFLFLCLSIDTREQSCIALNHYFFLTMTVVCTWETDIEVSLSLVLLMMRKIYASYSKLVIVNKIKFINRFFMVFALK